MRRPPRLCRAAVALALGALAAVLVACGSSGAGLIPAEDAGPLGSDFHAVERAANEGNGSCTATEAALLTTERDLQRLPRSVDAGLRSRLRVGTEQLRKLALEVCAQPHAQTATGATTTAPPVKAPPSTTSTETQTPTTATPPASTVPSPGGTSPPSSEEGGTAPGEGEEGQREGGAGAELGSAGGSGEDGKGGGGKSEGGKDGGGISGGTGSGGER